MAAAHVVLSVNRQRASDPEEAPALAVEERAKRRKKGVILLAAVLLVAAIVAIVVVVTVGGGGSDEDEDDGEDSPGVSFPPPEVSSPPPSSPSPPPPSPRELPPPPAASACPPRDPALRFDQAVLAASHNSYSGGYKGDRRSVWEQLDGCVRAVELDIHDDRIQEEGDYVLGHWLPEHEVAVGEWEPGNSWQPGMGNPSSYKLSHWLSMIYQWSAAHPQHTPITVYIDVKDDLTKHSDAASGNLEHLDEVVKTALNYPAEDTLFPASALGHDDPWPALGDLSGNVLVVMSGHLATRTAYAASNAEPVLFVECQPTIASSSTPNGGNPYTPEDICQEPAARFFAARAYDSQHADSLEPLPRHRPFRAWKYDEATEGTLTIAPNFPATDYPFEEWYTTEMGGGTGSVQR